MSETNNDLDGYETAGRVTKPSLAQVKIIVEFIKNHPQLAQRKPGNCSQKLRKLWSELSNIVNSIDGTFKTTKGWIKYWADKKRHVQLKNRQIQQGKTSEVLCPLEHQILELCDAKLTVPKKKKAVKLEPLNEDEDSADALFSKEDDMELSRLKKSELNETEERYTNIMEKIVDAMDQQATALAQMAQASLDNAKALEKVSEAAHLQAMALERLSYTFVDITTSVQDVRNSIMNIDFTIKRFYPTATSNERHNSNFFS